MDQGLSKAAQAKTKMVPNRTAHSDLPDLIVSMLSEG